MIISAAFVPSAPLLVPAVAQGAAAELDHVRGAAIAAISDALSGADRVVLVGAGTTTRTLTTGRGGFRGFGVPLDVALDPSRPGLLAEAPLPLSLTVGAWLLAEFGWTGARAALELDAAADDDELDAAGAALASDDARTALVVVADGSSTRTEKAPGYLNPEAEPFDAAVAAALASGDAQALAAVDRGTALAVGSAGRPAWRVASAALGGSAYDAQLLVDDAPYGVAYLVALWR